MKWVWLLVLSISSTFTNYAVAFTYGPSLVSLTKYNKAVHGPTLFNPETGRLLHLSDYPNFSVTVPLALDSPSATSNQVFVSRRISGPGEFIVEAPPGHGVMAVVQRMDFRTASTGCNDFIQFGELEGVETTGTCGKVDNRDGSLYPSQLIGPRVFRSPSGKMRVLFYHGYIWGYVRNFNFDLLDPSRNPVLQVEIVFTAYKECNTTQTEYKSCSKSLYSSTCIPSALFCDRVLNCGFDQDFASDELISNCYPDLYKSLLIPQSSQEFPFPSSAYFGTSTTSLPTTTTPKTTTTPTTITPSTTTTPRPTSTTPTITTTTPPSTTTTPPSTTTSSTTQTTTTPPITITTIAPFAAENSEETDSISSFTKKLRDHFFAVSSKPTTPSTESPYYILSETYNSKKNFSLDQEINTNMTFSESNDLSVDVGEEKVELLQDESKSIEEELDKENSSGLIIGLSIATLALIAFLVCLRIYCCNTVIWIPNPKKLRRRRKKSESSVYETESGITPDEIPQKPKRKGSTKTLKETPPPYDALFPKPEEKEEV